ncbi:hypothetical protein [Micropruina sp.]|uniref:hypothetical protein n=1 Tax=Micropruina sp. TaxID=2737536 RepID=UPI0039E357DD
MPPAQSIEAKLAAVEAAEDALPDPGGLDTTSPSGLNRIADALIDLHQAGIEAAELNVLWVNHSLLVRAAEAGDIMKTRRLLMVLNDTLDRIETQLRVQVLDDPSNPEVAAAELFKMLPSADLVTWARILGVTEKTVSTWRGGTKIRPKNARRVLLVALCAEAIRGSFTPTGVALWFTSEHPRLGASPVDLMNDDVDRAWQPLLEYADSARR